MIRLHIGHHFFGAGNAGDDLMLAGYLRMAGRASVPSRMTCCIPFDRAGQERRFPEVRWLPYTPDNRETCIRECDAWLGLGGSPFQTDSGPWSFDHLAGELELCRGFGKPMFFLGVGVNDEAALGRPEASELVRYALRIWTRDRASADGLAALGGGGRIEAGADLAHIVLSSLEAGEARRDKTGFVLHFENPDSFSAKAVAAAIERRGGADACAWIAQEARLLPGSERDLWDRLPGDPRTRPPLRVPDYAGGSLGDLILPWNDVSFLVTSRYHAALIGAWMGCAVLIVERNKKMRDLGRQMETESVADVRDEAVLLQALSRCRPVSSGLRRQLSLRAEAMCLDFLSGL